MAAAHTRMERCHIRMDKAVAIATTGRGAGLAGNVLDLLLNVISVSLEMVKIVSDLAVLQGIS